MKAGQPIGDDPSACAGVLLRPGGDFGTTEALDDGELHAQRVSLLVIARPGSGSLARHLEPDEIRRLVTAVHSATMVPAAATTRCCL